MENSDSSNAYGPVLSQDGSDSLGMRVRANLTGMEGSGRASMAFLAELKRRRVGKVAIGYGAVAWAVTEGASVVFPAFACRMGDDHDRDFPAGRVSDRDGARMGLRRHAQGIQRTEPLAEEVEGRRASVCGCARPTVRWCS